MIRVDILDFYDKKVKNKYASTLMRKTTSDTVVWENTSADVASFAAHLMRTGDDFFFEMDGIRHKNIHNEN